MTAVAAHAACNSARVDREEIVTYTHDLRAVLDARCAACHNANEARGGWDASSYGGAVGCVASGSSAIGGGSNAPILRALDRDDHRGLLSNEQAKLLERWVGSGAPSVIGGAHPQAFLDPRSDASHGNFLRAKRYRPMLDGEDDDACGKCHDGAMKPARPTLTAPGATACTTCHANGALSCKTCHGAGDALYPPRDPCFHPEQASDRSHRAHAGPSPSRSDGFACSVCHPPPGAEDLGGTHADGFVEVWFDYGVAGREAVYEAREQACSGTCHAHGGARPIVRWQGDAAMTCTDCHATPPANHYGGACSGCHREANDDGTALIAPKLHAGGKVVLGDGSGSCGACHGEGASPWPTSGAHQAHRSPTNARPVACETCHEVPAPGDRHPTGAGVGVRLRGLAVSGGARATFDPTTKVCANTYCHTGPGGTSRSPSWTTSGTVVCGSCHATPPPPPHTPATDCQSCHGPLSNDTHVDGFVTP